MTPGPLAYPGPARARTDGSGRSISVLWLIKGLGPGGAERLLVHHAATRAYREFRYEAAYLVPWKHHLVPELAAAGVPSVCLDAGKEWDLRWALRLRRRLARDPVDVLHVHSPYVAAVARLLSRTLPRSRRPALVYTEHNRWGRHAKPTRVANRVTFRLDDADLAVSEGVRESMPPPLRDRVEVLIHGIDIETIRARRSERDEVRDEFGVAADEVLVGTVANLRREKAYPDLMAAAAEVLSSGAPIRFVAVGQGPLEAELRELHAQLGLGHGFQLLGYREDAIRVLAGCDLFALSSVHEGLPVSLMEALALGIPTVATAVGGIPEAISDGVEGVLVPPSEPSRLARAILDLAADPDRRARMAVAASERARAFGVAPAVDRTEAIYRQLARSREKAARGRQAAPSL